MKKEKKIGQMDFRLYLRLLLLPLVILESDSLMRQKSEGKLRENLKHKILA